VVGVEADLVDVEVLCRVDIGHGYGDKLGLPAHGRELPFRPDRRCRVVRLPAGGLSRRRGGVEECDFELSTIRIAEEHRVQGRTESGDLTW